MKFPGVRERDGLDDSFNNTTEKSPANVDGEADTSGDALPETTPILNTHDLSLSYGANRAVDQLNLSVNRGEIYGFLGRNGAGKTSTIRMIMGICKPGWEIVVRTRPTKNAIDAQYELQTLESFVAYSTDFVGGSAWYQVGYLQKNGDFPIYQPWESIPLP